MPLTVPPNEDAVYRHEELGCVRVVSVDGDEVAFEHVSETVHVDGVTAPRAWHRPIVQFADSVEPADAVVGVSAETVTTSEAYLR